VDEIAHHAARARVLDQQSEGLITMDELKSALAGIEEERTTIQGELSALDNAEVTWNQLLSMRDVLLERSRSGFFEAAMITPEQRHNTYRDMGLRVELDDEGNPIISGAFDLFSKVESSARRRSTATPRSWARLGLSGLPSETTGGT
jgi:hypothetical protein